MHIALDALHGMYGRILRWSEAQGVGGPWLCENRVGVVIVGGSRIKTDMELPNHFGDRDARLEIGELVTDTSTLPQSERNEVASMRLEALLQPSMWVKPPSVRPDLRIPMPSENRAERHGSPRNLDTLELVALGANPRIKHKARRKQASRLVDDRHQERGVMSGRAEQLFAQVVLVCWVRREHEQRPSDVGCRSVTSRDIQGGHVTVDLLPQGE